MVWSHVKRVWNFSIIPLGEALSQWTSNCDVPSLGLCKSLLRGVQQGLNLQILQFNIYSKTVPPACICRLSITMSLLKIAHFLLYKINVYLPYYILCTGSDCSSLLNAKVISNFHCLEKPPLSLGIRIRVRHSKSLIFGPLLDCSKFRDKVKWGLHDESASCTQIYFNKM